MDTRVDYRHRNHKRPWMVNRLEEPEAYEPIPARYVFATAGIALICSMLFLFGVVWAIQKLTQ